MVSYGKKVKNLYLRKDEHKFILQSIFICRAKYQKWTNEEINEVIEKTIYEDKIRVYEILLSLAKKFSIRCLAL
ncbi:TPA: hypothetical protein JI018_17900 [Acinetobacter baumannii]|uniref:Transposase n=1 Tax=Acinetobacter baumannii TaxID=470 RepID=A0AAX0TEW6_ACIBA|nr:hypothetical protein Aba10324_18340 [Acinetobacter baumannii]KAA8946813.1 hypothetical protein DLI66_19255 [Acinetobacter baumannii]PHQ01012.1 hypothetical protein CPI82_19695 [Acinetobacter baumannii]PSE06003.1 hypothetical protein C7G98_18735 [Acinetobacter baumannii]PUV03198.1 hypothetical protein DCD77_16035 [Acinetobacter baumannii]